MYQCYIKKCINEWIERNSDISLPPLKQLSPKLRRFIIDLYKDFKITTHAKLYMFLHNMKETPICNVCNNKHVRSFIDFKQGFSHFCSIACSNRSPETKYKKVLAYREHYGCDNCFQAEEVKRTIVQTTRRLFGVDNVSQNEDIKRTKVETCLTNNGVEYPFQNEEIRNRCIEDWKKKYNGKTNPSQVPEVQVRKEVTCFGHYGVRHPAESEVVKQRISNSFFIKYGVPNITQSIEFLSKSRKKYYYNGIYFDSSFEIMYYCYLIRLGKRFIYQVDGNFSYIYDNKIHYYFPDFYIEDDDIFVEIKGSHFFENGKMICPYNRNRDEEFQVKYEMMKSIPNLKIILDDDFKSLGLNVKTSLIRKLTDKLRENKVTNFDMDLLEMKPENFSEYMKRAEELKQI